MKPPKKKAGPNPSFTLHGSRGVCPFQLRHLRWINDALLNGDIVLFIASFLPQTSEGLRSCSFLMFIDYSIILIANFFFLDEFDLMHLFTHHFPHQQWTHTHKPGARAAGSTSAPQECRNGVWVPCSGAHLIPLTAGTSPVTKPPFFLCATSYPKELNYGPLISIALCQEANISFRLKKERVSWLFKWMWNKCINERVEKKTSQPFFSPLHFGLKTLPNKTGWQLEVSPSGCSAPGEWIRSSVAVRQSYGPQVPAESLQSQQRFKHERTYKRSLQMLHAWRIYLYLKCLSRLNGSRCFPNVAGI